MCDFIRSKPIVKVHHKLMQVQLIFEMTLDSSARFFLFASRARGAAIEQLGVLITRNQEKCPISAVAF